MRRVVVVGNSGSGKTTFARALAARLGVPAVELDSIYHQPGWTSLEPEDFQAAVAAVTVGDGWVVDGNYSVLNGLHWRLADTFIWLDYSRAVVTRRILARTIPRVWTREELWNGNREHWSNLLSLDKERSVVVWSITQHGAYRRRYLQEMTGPRWAHGRILRLREPREADQVLRSAVPVDRELAEPPQNSPYGAGDLDAANRLDRGDDERRDDDGSRT